MFIEKITNRIPNLDITDDDQTLIPTWVVIYVAGILVAVACLLGFFLVAT